MSRRPDWEKLLERFDVAVTSADPTWWADRPSSPAGAIIEDLGVPRGTPRVLLTGAVGIGKTTELLRVAQQRTRDDFVVYLDLDRHFSEVVGDSAALQKVQSWEVCLLAGLALLRAAEERLGRTFPPQHVADLAHAWSRLSHASDPEAVPPQLDLAKLGKAMILVASAAAPLVLGPGGAAVVGGLTVLDKAVDGAKWVASLGRASKKLPDQDADIQSLVGAVNVLIGLVQQRATRVLLVLDGLDRIRDPERARDLFVDSNLIAHLDAKLVVCGPIALRHSTMGASIRGFTDQPVLQNEPVLDHVDPRQHGPGIEFFRDLYGKRVAGIHGPPLLATEHIECLAYCSGGRARDFVEFVWQVARSAYGRDVDAADAPIIDKIVRQNRLEREEGMTTDHIELLERIAADPRQRPPRSPLVDELLATGSLLPFPNKSEWFYPHPLLMMNLVKTPPAGPRA
jgi:hypothetical protein